MLYLSKIKYMDDNTNVLKIEFLKSPDKNLVVIDFKEKILSFYILGDINIIPGPIKFQLKNKLRLLVFSKVSRFGCKIDNSLPSYFRSLYFSSKFDEAISNFDEAISNTVGNKSGIPCRWDSNDDYRPMYDKDIDLVGMFYRTLEFKCPHILV